MATVGHQPATLDDLYRTEGKAELIGGRIVQLMATGFLPNRVAGRIFRSLDDHAEQIGQGVAVTDNMGFAVPELPSVFQQGDLAHAEPAVSGWRIPLSEVFA